MASNIELSYPARVERGDFQLRFCIASAAVFCTLASPVIAGALDWRVGGQFGFEQATGLGYDHDNERETPPLRVQDYRYTLEAFVGAGLETDIISFDVDYKYDQRTYEDYNVLHSARQQITATAATTLFAGTDLSVRYRFRRSQPEGQIGSIDYNQIRGRFDLPRFNAGLMDLGVRPYVMSDWNSGDFKKRDGLDGTGWSGTGGVNLDRGNTSWSTDFSVAYGERQAKFFFFTYDYVDTTVVLSGELGSWARWIAMDTASTTFELSYRDEWYDGTIADDGHHRRDRELAASFDLTRPMSDVLDFTSSVDIENHESNWIVQDYLESRIMVGFRAEF